MKQINYSKIFLIALLLTAALYGQLLAQDESSQGTAGLDSQVLKVYFFLLVFATIISRLVEYIKVIFEWLWQRVPLLSKLSEGIWRLVKRQLDKLALEYNAVLVRSLVDKIVTTFAVHTLGFVLGVIICLQFRIGMIDILGWTQISPTLNFIFTGILIGAGIDPVHAVFRWASEKKKLKNLYAQVSATQK